MLAAENHRTLFEDDFDSKLLNDKDLMLKLIENGCTKLADDFIPEKIRHDKALVEAVWSKQEKEDSGYFNRYGHKKWRIDQSMEPYHMLARCLI